MYLYKRHTSKMKLLSLLVARYFINSLLSQVDFERSKIVHVQHPQYSLERSTATLTLYDFAFIYGRQRARNTFMHTHLNENGMHFGCGGDFNMFRMIKVIDTSTRSTRFRRKKAQGGGEKVKVTKCNF